MTNLQHAKMVYANDIMHIHIQIKAENIYMVSIYMYSRLGVGLYGPYIGIYADIECNGQYRGVCQYASLWEPGPYLYYTVSATPVAEQWCH